MRDSNPAEASKPPTQNSYRFQKTRRRRGTLQALIVAADFESIPGVDILFDLLERRTQQLGLLRANPKPKSLNADWFIYLLDGPVGWLAGWLMDGWMAGWLDG